MTLFRLCVLATLLTACGSTSGVDGGFVKPDTAVPIDVTQWQGMVDAGTLAFLVELGKAKRCESADLDGDGIREMLCIRAADGTQTWVKETNGGAPAFKIERFADGRVRYSYWYLNSNFPAILDEEFPDGHRTTLFDSDHDRKFERSVDEVPDGGDIVATEYVNAGSVDGGLVFSRQWVRPASSDQGGGARCDGNSNFPSEISLWQGGDPPGFSDKAAVKCNPTLRAKLATAFECARKKLECVGRTNPSMKKQVDARMLDDDLQYGCGNPCADALATTLPASGPYKGQTNFNGSRLASWTPEEACTTVLHELLHAAKVSEGPSHADGTDAIYSCARYCSNCIDFGGAFGAANPFPSDNMDCVRCAETAADKKRCGIKSELMGGPCPSYALCHGGIGVNTQCATCENRITKDCEGTQAGPPEFNCCKTCPANATTNDKVCPGPFLPSDTCMSKPPECP